MSATARQIAILADRDAAAAIEAALRDGSARLICEASPENLPTVAAAEDIGWIVLPAETVRTLFQDRAEVTAELTRTRAALEERKVVERAKGVLMSQRGLSEPQAYRTLQKLAMDRKRKIADIARSVLDMADLFPPS